MKTLLQQLQKRLQSKKLIVTFKSCNVLKGVREKSSIPEVMMVF